MPDLTIHAGKADFLALAITNSTPLFVEVTDRTFLFYPHKILEFSQELVVVGEDVERRCMMDIPLKEIVRFHEQHSVYQSNFTTADIDEFIKGIREVEENAVRLILKIDHTLHQIDLPEGYHHLGKTYVTTNSEGDRIWAATVEPGLGLIEWIYSMRYHVEILDPSSVKEEYYRYCQYLQSEGA